MTTEVHIGSGAGFAGDRSDAAIPVVATLAQIEGPTYLIYEVMGERTLAIAQRLKQENPEAGYSPWLDLYLPGVLADCKKNNIKIVANFGNANPEAAARKVLELAQTQNVSSLRVGVVLGDDLTQIYSTTQLSSFPAIEGTQTEGRSLIAANAYLGAAPIVKALELGVDIVLVGRTTDAALVLGPLIHEFGWSSENYDLLAAGTVAGHLLECGAQVTGGYFADPGFKDVPDLHMVGFPVAKVKRTGEVELTKANNTGGVVNRQTVIEQLLYEVHDPFNYLTPDVIVDYSKLTVEQLGENVVRISGAIGRAPTSTLKATLSVDGGWLGEAEISYAGPNALARAELAVSVISERCRGLGINEPCRIEIIGTGSVLDDDGSSRYRLSTLDSAGEYRVRAAIRSAKKEVAQSVADEVLALFCCGPAGGGGVRQSVTRQVSTASILIDRTEIEAKATAIEVTA